MNNETFFIVVPADNPISSRVKTLAEAFALIAGKPGNHSIEECDTMNGPVRQYRVSVRSFKISEDNAS